MRAKQLARWALARPEQAARRGTRVITLLVTATARFPPFFLWNIPYSFTILCVNGQNLVGWLFAIIDAALRSLNKSNQEAALYVRLTGRTVGQTHQPIKMRRFVD